MSLTEIFGEAISTYSDADAVDDGVLVDTTELELSFQGMPVNRVTGGLWNDLAAFCPVDREDEAALLPALRSMIETKLSAAIYQGDTWILPPRLWLIENEVDGWTLMYPEDY